MDEENQSAMNSLQRYESTGIHSASVAAVCRWLPDGPAMQDTMDSMVGKAYTYGRTFLTAKVSLHLWSHLPYHQGESTPTTKMSLHLRSHLPYYQGESAPTVAPSLPPR